MTVAEAAAAVPVITPLITETASRYLGVRMFYYRELEVACCRSDGMKLSELDSEKVNATVPNDTLRKLTRFRNAVVSIAFHSVRSCVAH